MSFEEYENHKRIKKLEKIIDNIQNQVDTVDYTVGMQDKFFEERIKRLEEVLKDFFKHAKLPYYIEYLEKKDEMSEL